MVRRAPEPNNSPLPPPAPTLEGRNEQLTVLAFNLAEKRLHDGSASAQEVVHFLKAGSTRDRLEQERLRKENLLLEARMKELESKKTVEELYQKAFNAFRGYSGQEPIEMVDENEY